MKGSRTSWWQSLVEEPPLGRRGRADHVAQAKCLPDSSWTLRRSWKSPAGTVAVINGHLANAAQDGQLLLGRFLLQAPNPVGHTATCSITSYFLRTSAMPPKASAEGPNALPPSTLLCRHSSLITRLAGPAAGGRHTKIYSSEIAPSPFPPPRAPSPSGPGKQTPSGKESSQEACVWPRPPFIPKTPLPVGKYKHCVKPF